MRRNLPACFSLNQKETLTFTRCRLQIVTCNNIPSIWTNRLFNNNCSSCPFCYVTNTFLRWSTRNIRRLYWSTAMKQISFGNYHNQRCKLLKECVPGEPWSLNQRFHFNLAQMFGLVSEWLWQKRGSKYLLTFKLKAPCVRMAIWH